MMASASASAGSASCALDSFDCMFLCQPMRACTCSGRNRAPHELDRSWSAAQSALRPSASGHPVVPVTRDIARRHCHETLILVYALFVDAQNSPFWLAVED